MFSLVSPRTPRSYPVKLLSSWAVPSIYFFFSPGAGFGISPCWISLGSCQPISQGRWCPCDGNMTLWYQPSFMFSEKFLIVCSASSSRSLMKIVKGLSIDPWDTRLVTSIQLDDDDGQSSAFGSACSSSFQPSSLSAHLSHTTTASLGGSYGRQCQRPSWSPSRQYPHSPHPAGQPFHCELSGWSSMTSLFVNPCWLLLIVFLSFICLEIFSWISWYVLANVVWSNHGSGNQDCYDKDFISSFVSTT